MELNNTQHKSFLWHLDFEPFTWHTFYGEQCPPFVTEENKEAWRRYLTKVIKKHLKAEVMNTSEFRDIELQIREEKLLRIKWDEQRKRSMDFSKTLPQWSLHPLRFPRSRGTETSLVLKGGSTSIPKPLSPQKQEDVAGDAIALPEFSHRQQSL